MIRAASVAVDVNLRNYSHFLQKNGIPHQISEESGEQVIWVANQLHQEFVIKSLADFPLDENKEPGQQHAVSSGSVLPDMRAAGSMASGLLGAFLRSPITMILVLLCLLVAVVSGLGSSPSRVEWLFFPPVSTSGLGSLLIDLLNPLYALRSLTPMFLHFGELHLIFNMLWLWFFGRQLEPRHPQWLYLLIIILISFVGNASQYLYSGYNNFGGMSGVVYGLVGYTWIIHNFMPRSNLLLRNSMFAIFVIALVMMEFFASSWIASAAHLGGLVGGLVLGVGSVVYYRFILKREMISR